MQPFLSKKCDDLQMKIHMYSCANHKIKGLVRVVAVGVGVGEDHQECIIKPGTCSSSLPGTQLQ